MSDESDDIATIDLPKELGGLSVTLRGGILRAFQRAFHPHRETTETAIVNALAKRVADGGVITETEMAAFGDALGERVQKLNRLRQIEERAKRRLPVAVSGSDQEIGEQPSNPSRDWFTKFREDASLVDDEQLQEAYARIMAEQAVIPESVPLVVLRTLRYLDRPTLEAFTRLTCGTIKDSSLTFIAQSRPVLDACEVSHHQLLDIADAGLIHPISSKWSVNDNSQRVMLFAYGQDKLVIISPGLASPKKLPVHTLTVAGATLARVVDRPEASPSIVDEVVRWLVPNPDIAAGGILIGNPPPSGVRDGEVLQVQSPVVWSPASAT